MSSKIALQGFGECAILQPTPRRFHRSTKLFRCFGFAQPCGGCRRRARNELKSDASRLHDICPAYRESYDAGITQPRVYFLVECCPVFTRRGEVGYNGSFLLVLPSSPCELGPPSSNPPRLYCLCEEWRNSMEKFNGKQRGRNKKWTKIVTGCAASASRKQHRKTAPWLFIL